MKSQSNDSDHRLMILEEKLEYQDYTIEKLNDVIIAQQYQIDTLDDNLARLREKMEASQIDLEVEENQELQPPHY